VVSGDLFKTKGKVAVFVRIMGQKRQENTRFDGRSGDGDLSKKRARGKETLTGRKDSIRAKKLCGKEDPG